MRGRCTCSFVSHRNLTFVLPPPIVIPRTQSSTYVHNMILREDQCRPTSLWANRLIPVVEITRLASSLSPLASAPMAQVYATKLPSRPSTPLSTSLAAPHRLHAIRTTYANAAHSFLLRDFPSTASHLSSVLSLLPPRPLPQSWLLNLQAGQEDAEGELRRKIDILTITFLATLHSLPAPVTPYPPLISAFLSLPAPALIQTLWNGLLEGNEEGEILPTPKAAFVHPSIITALTLCALKLDEPRFARSVAESWFGSTSEQVEGYIVSVIEGDGLDLAVGEFGVGMGGSMSIGRKKGGRALVGCWLRLLDLLTLHVLPRLGEWEAGEDFVRLQSGENGGWLPDARVEVSCTILGMCEGD